MKKDSFLLEFLKSGPFLLLLIIALAVTLGVVIANHHREVVKMRENVIYVTPKHQK
jgi:cell division protein FtsL